MKESKSNKSLKETLDRFERFIGTNGLLKNFSRNFIECPPPPNVQSRIDNFFSLSMNDKISLVIIGICRLLFI